MDRFKEVGGKKHFKYLIVWTYCQNYVCGWLEIQHISLSIVNGASMTWTAKEKLHRRSDILQQRT